MDSTKLINFFIDNKIKFRIEVEGKEKHLLKEGINNFKVAFVKRWDNDVNKWGVEYRLYFNGEVPEEYRSLVKENSFYNTDVYENIINNNDLIRDMLNKGCHLGNNNENIILQIIYYIINSIFNSNK